METFPIKTLGDVLTGHFSLQHPNSKPLKAMEASALIHGKCVMASDGHYQQDNLPCHTARIFTLFEEQAGEFMLMSWPSNFPDMNSIKHLWLDLEKHVSVTCWHYGSRKQRPVASSLNQHLAMLQLFCGLKEDIR